MTHQKVFIETGRAVIQLAAQAVVELEKRVDEQFVQACTLLLKCTGRVVVVGIGKSGHIGKKIAATLASTGTPAFFVHAAEASHGDLGMLTKQDTVLALSNSGETHEVISLLPLIKSLSVPLIALTGNSNSTLAKQATVHINTGVKKEACPLGLAPTSSTTATLVMGDALAIALLEARGFTKTDFAKVHPKGNLGLRLLLRVSDIMHRGDQIPRVVSGSLLPQALLEISQKRLGVTLVVNPENQLVGIFTDGDLRRVIERGTDIVSTTIDDVMTHACKTITEDLLASEALAIMESHKITGLAVVQGNNVLIGFLHIHDVLSTGIG